MNTYAIYLTFILVSFYLYVSESTNLPAAVFSSSLCQLLDELEHGQYQLPNESAQISAQCDHVRPVMPTELGNDTTCGGGGVSLPKMQARSFTQISTGGIPML